MVKPDKLTIIHDEEVHSKANISIASVVSPKRHLKNVSLIDFKN